MLRVKDEFFGHGVVRDPHPKLAEMQAECPVHRGSMPEIFGIEGPETILFSPETPQVSVLTYDAAEKVFKDHRTFSARWYMPSLRRTIGRTILEMDPPEHGRYRQLIQGAFTRKEMERWEAEFVRDLVDAYLDRIVSLGRADLAADFAIQYPLRVLVEACELPQDDVEMFYNWAAHLTNVGIPEDVRLRVAEDFGEYLFRVINRRRDNPGKDLVSLLATAQFRGADDDGAEHRLNDEEIVSFLRLLLPAGAQTTYRTLCNLLLGLLTHPEQLQAIYDDRSLIPQAIEEGLRWEPPLIAFGREATADTDIAGCPIGKGTMVNLVVAAADRDPSRWERPGEFDIFRPQLPHLAFGTGNHVCLGIHFARMELRVALEQILDRLPNLRLDPTHEDVYIGGLGARSPDTLPVLFGLTERSE
jgi:cytochrome P450